MHKVVLDSTVLLSAFLAKTGVSAGLLHKAKDGGFDMCLAEEILEEVQRALLQYQKIRKRYQYTDQTVIQFIQNLRIVARLITELPSIEVVNSDPNDNMVVACALKARADYIVTRDNDLLSLENYEDIKVVTPEKFMGILGVASINLPSKSIYRRNRTAIHNLVFQKIRLCQTSHEIPSFGSSFDKYLTAQNNSV